MTLTSFKSTTLLHSGYYFTLKIQFLQYSNETLIKKPNKIFFIKIFYHKYYELHVVTIIH